MMALDNDGVPGLVELEWVRAGGLGSVEARAAQTFGVDVFSQSSFGNSMMTLDNDGVPGLVELEWVRAGGLGSVEARAAQTFGVDEPLFIVRK